MGKVGRVVTDPKAGAYCQITLDSGEKIIVNHERRVGEGMINVEIAKFMGFSSERIFSCDLDSQAGQSALGRLTQGASASTFLSTPLGAFVEYLKHCASVKDVKDRCAVLGSRR
jgi:hypothetical protein